MSDTASTSQILIVNQQESCVFCDVKFESKEELQTHFRKHATGEIPILNALQKQGRFNRKPAIKADGKSNGYTTEKICCDECTEQFETVSLTIQHKHKKHKNSTIRYYCIYCGMQFPLKYSLEVHMKTHPNEAKDAEENCKHICLTCGFSFHNAKALEYHKTKVHNRYDILCHNLCHKTKVHNRVTLQEKVETPPPSSKVRQMNDSYYPVYFCHLCGSEYCIKYNLERHLSDRHTQEEREALPTQLVSCETCDAIFFGEKPYHNHLLSHKEDDLIIRDPAERLKLVRMDLDFDPNRVQSTVDRYLEKETIRKRKIVVQPRKEVEESVEPSVSKKKQKK
ncbi:zinc finger and SCAN domain-containing protein 10-like isoform X2 [Artemia franciscana]|uniref:zinc finger and SCAN domain-containing protein 10-like isoform X2 n=1 Tax=Artemia franciscana TaxID=6661 RepID=UPI0032DA29C9